MTSAPIHYDVDFSLAIRNRTGKYVIGREIIADHADRIGKVFYWRTPLATAPSGWLARGLDAATNAELTIQRKLGITILPPARHRNPVLHLDPYTVCTTRIGPADIVLVHDLGPITHPELFDPGVYSLYHRAFQRIAAGRPRLVFVSQASRDAFVAHYGPVDDMRVIYPPIRAEVGTQTEEPVAGIDGPFLLTVGSIGRRKNQLRSIEAFACSKLAALGYRYVLCGAREPGAEEVEIAAKNTMGVHLLPFVNNRQLAWLYANASGFVLVSLLEGFGMPVAEAIARGLIPIVTQDSVLEEVAGSAAFAVPYNNVDAIAQAMRELVNLPMDDAARRKSLLGKAIATMNATMFKAAWSDILQASKPQTA